jgi:quercetin dioxygenase-like cupin family protein
MSNISVFEEAKTLAEKHAHTRLKSRLVDADTFEIDLWVFHVPGEGELHTCERDEFFYVLKGSMELQVDDTLHLLKAGEGLNVKARIKHKHATQGDTWVMVTSKWPHEHIYDDAEA